MKNRIAIFGLVTAVLLGYGMYQALVAAPTERTMGDVQRIFYIHVPSAWVAFLCFFGTQHPQPVIAGGQGSGLAAPILYAFLVNLVAFTAYGALVLWIRYGMERLRRELEDQQALRAVADVQAEGATR